MTTSEAIKDANRAKNAPEIISMLWGTGQLLTKNLLFRRNLKVINDTVHSMTRLPSAEQT